MCNCNSSFCAVCCRRVKAYRFDNVPEITGDLQLYTEFYKVGEAYGHWKFTIDDLEAYLDIPTVLWSDKLVAFGHTATGGLFYQSDFIFDYTTSSFTIGTRGVGTEGQYSASIGVSNIVDTSSLAIGEINTVSNISLAIGFNNSSSAGATVHLGEGNVSSNTYNNILGNFNTSSGKKVNIIGHNNTVTDNGNVILSDQTGGSSSIIADAFTAQFAGGYRFRLDAASTAVNISSTGIVTIDNVVNNNTETQLLVWNTSTKEIEYRTASSLPFGTGTVTAVNSGAGMDFTNFTTSGTIILGAGSDITLASTNSVSGTTHTHELTFGGTSSQVVLGDKTLGVYTPVNWTDKLIAFGHTLTGGVFYQSDFIFDYTTSSFIVGNSTNSGVYSAAIGESNLLTGDFSLISGANNDNSGNNSALFGQNHISSGLNAFAIGDTNIIDVDYCTTIGYNLNTAGNLGSVMISDSIGGVSSTRPDSFTARFEGGYRFMSDSSTVAVSIKSSSGEVFINTVANNNTEDQLLVWNVSTKEVEYRDVSSLPGGGGGSVTSVDAAFLNGTALTVVGGAITTAGTFDFEWQGLNTDYVAGDGSIIAFPTLTSGTVTSVSAGNGMTFTTITSTGAVTLGTPSSITLASTNSVGVGTHSHLFAPGGTTAQYIRGDGTLATTPLGSVTSVGMTITAATALSVTGSPITTSGTFAVTWTGNNTQYVAGDGSLITFPTLTSGTVTAVNSGAGMDFTNFTTSGTIILGTPSTITLASVNAATGTTHSHEFDLGGTAGQYLAGDTTLQTFPTIPTVTPSALTRTNDTNILLNLTGSNTTALLQAVDIEVAWSGLLSYTRGGTGLGSLGTANQILRVNAGATALEYFTPSWTSNTGTVTNFSANDLTTGYTYPLFTVNVTDPTTTPDLTFSLPSLPQKFVFAAPWGVTGTPLWRQLLPSDLQADGASTGQVIAWNGTAWVPSAASGGYWSRSGTVLYTTTSADAVVINTATSNSALARLNVGELGYTAANYQSNIGLHQTDTYGIDKGVSISGYPQAGGSYLGVGKIGFYKENATLNNQDTYFSISTRTGASNVTVDSTKFKISGAGLVTITNIPSSSSSVNLVVSNSGTLESRTIASLAYYTSGTGISIAGPVITNTLPSKWQIIGALYLTPSVSAYDIATPITGSIGYVTMTKGTASQCGYFEVRTAAAARVGYIGYQTGYMNYSSDIGNHRFNGGTVQINNIPSGSTSLNILTTNGGVVETRTIASLTGLPSSVWYLQGGTTAPTNTSQNIYRTGDVWLNTGSTGAGGYKFRVTGDSYFEAQQYFAYATYQVWRNSANNAWLNGIRYNTSNQLELGQSSFDIYLPGYTSSRSVDTKTLLDKTLFVNSSGVVKSESSEWVRNDGASCWITSTESHLADNTNRRVTFDVSASTSNTYYTFSYSSGDYKMFFPGSYSQHLVICTLEYTTSGTPTVTATLRKTSTVVETNISTSADGRKVMTIHAIMSGTSSDYPTLYIYNATGGASITLQKCKITMIPLGETPP